MAGAKEIKSKIASVESTQKITSAMEMVATSKMRNAQLAMQASKPYAHILKRVISHIAKSKPNAHNPYIEKREVTSACFIVVSTDRGLCGGLNSNLFKKVLHTISDYSERGIRVELALIGSKAVSFFESVGIPIAYKIQGLGDKPTAEDSLGFTQGLVKDYLEGRYQFIELFANKFINTMTQEPTRSQFLPLPQLPSYTDKLEEDATWDYIYEGDSKHLLEGLIVRYIENIVHSTILETLACEQAARMIAMKAATDNASTMIDELKLVYNKARQSSITNELNEIVAGAAAV